MFDSEAIAMQKARSGAEGEVKKAKKPKVSIAKAATSKFILLEGWCVVSR